MKSNKYALALLIGTTVLSSAAYAANATSTLTMPAHLSFDTPLSITKNNDIQFGYLKASQAGTYIIATNNALSASNGGVTLGGSPQAGSLTIAGSSTQQINISVGNYVVDHGVTPSAATCAYNGGAAVACNLTSQSAPGAGAVLLLGLTAAVDGSQAAGTTAQPSFDVTVSYM